MEIREIYEKFDKYKLQTVIISGWIKNVRAQKTFGFIDLHDGSYFKSAQVVYDESLANFSFVSKLRVGTAIKVVALVEETANQKQPFDLKAKTIELLGDADADYPIQPKRHTREFLREIPHLRVRTNLFNAVFKVRHLLAHAIHEFFKTNNFTYVHTPIITSIDGEGTGEMFKVTSFDLENIPKTADGKIDYKQDFFQKPSHLTVTGQLHIEAFLPAFGTCYTFGPTFRSENSNTKTHAAEFWMIEAEAAFYDLEDNMLLAENMIKYVIKYVLKQASLEMKFLDSFVEKGLINKLSALLSSSFAKVTHKEAVDILLAAVDKGTKFEFTPTQGGDLATEHEKYLVEHFQGPVYVIDWPKEIKAFYMRSNRDGQTVAAMDLLVPGAGELIGGSQREERLDLLIKRMKELNICLDELDWYLDLRKYGETIHSGFGIGFERLVMYITGIENIRDVIPFPRTVRNCKY